VRLGVIPSALLEWLHLEALGDCVTLWDSLVSLGGCRHLDGLVQRGLSSGCWWLSPALIVVIMMGYWPFPGREPKGILVDCSWLVWSSSYIGCAAPYWEFGVWCQLARELPSEWIATMRTSLLVSKWTLVKIIVSSCPEDFIDYLVIDWLAPSCDWLTPRHGDIIITIPLLYLHS
jgi:hypothetical protein